MQKIGQTLPLSLVRAGETVTVCRVRGNEDMKRHLQEIGFVDGARCMSSHHRVEHHRPR